MKLLIAILLGCAALVARTIAAEALLEIDKEHSHVEADITATMHSFVAKLETYDCAISVDPETNRVTYAQIHFRFTDFKTGSASRDQEMRDWQTTEQFPECVFWMMSQETAPDGKILAHGKLIFHGQTRDLTCSFRLKSADKKSYAIDGETELDTQDYGLPIFRKFGMLKVDPVVKVHFHLQATTPAAKTSSP